nr:MAG TPA: NlpC/P60 family [Caudoviricetes sp.]
METMFNYDDLIGIPFVDGGRDITGLDCWGLALELFKRQGYIIHDYSISSEEAHVISDTMQYDLNEMWQKIEEPKIGCLVIIRLAENEWANHCGVYIGDGHFIHAYCHETGVVIDRVRKWKSRILGFYIPTERALYND